MFLRWGGRWFHSESGTGSAIIDAATADAILAEVGFFDFVMDCVRLAVVLLGFFFDAGVVDVVVVAVAFALILSRLACRFHFRTSVFAVDATS